MQPYTEQDKSRGLGLEIREKNKEKKTRQRGRKRGGLACAFPAYHGAHSHQPNPGGLSPHKRPPPREDAGPRHLSDGPAAIRLTAARAVIRGRIGNPAE